MKCQVQIEYRAGQVNITAPYSPNNNEHYRARGGRFDKPSSAWLFADTPAVNKMIDELFGPASPLCLVRVHMRDLETDGNQWGLGGYVVASRRSRDSRVEMPEGVLLEEGYWQSSGGSMKSPRVSGTDVVVNLVMRSAFAERKGLEIIKRIDDPEPEPASPLAGFTDAELIAELENRGFRAEPLEKPIIREDCGFGGPWK